MKKLSFEEHQEIGKKIKSLKRELYELMRMLSGRVPLSFWEYQTRRIDKAITTLKSDMDDKLFQECGEKDFNVLVNVYYGE